MIEDIMRETEERMSKAIKVLRNDLATIRTGRASPALVETLRVEHYGTSMPLNQMAAISVPEPRLLVIRPWDPEALPSIEKAILKSDLGLTPTNDGRLIRLVIPRLTEERRRELIKVMGRRVEEAKVAIRNCRRDALRDMRELEREKLISEDDYYRSKVDVQDLTDRFINEIDDIRQKKETEIMET